ncbi:MAG: hypothetical protein ABIL68_03810, partial [bacterium]
MKRKMENFLRMDVSMRRSSFIFLLFSVLGITAARTQHVDVIVVDGPITPVTAKYISDGVNRAERDDAECLVI